MNGFKKIVVFLMAFVLCCTAVACNKEEKTPDSSSGYGYIDQIQIEETDAELIAGGRSDYSVVIPENASVEIQFAASELVSAYDTSTGVKLSTITDSMASYSPENKYISIGNTSLFEEAGLTLRSDLGRSGVQMFTVGNILFLNGGSDSGALFAVYELLERTMGFMIYADDEIAVDHKSTVYFPSASGYAIPAVDAPIGSYYSNWNMSRYTRRMRMYSSEDWYIYKGGHNGFGIMPPDTYRSAHPDWYSPSGSQLCYSNYEMADQMIENIKVLIDADTEHNVMMIGIEDNRDWCTCDACLASKQKYGVDSAVHVKFMNYVVRHLNQWLEEERDGRKIEFVFFAYLSTLAPPVKMENGKYVPFDDSVVLEDNICPQYAPLDASFDRTFDHVDNKAVAETLSGWKAVSKKMYIWSYACNFNHYMVNFNNFNTMQANYKYLIERGVSYYMDQASYNTPTPCFEALRIFLMSRLMWDVDRDFNQLLDDFFTNYYKDAAPYMREYFDGIRNWYAYLETSKGLRTGSIYADIETTEFWPKAVLDMQLSTIDKAYEAIEYYKTVDPAMYEKLYSRINLESLSPRYLLCVLYENSYTPSEIKALRSAFKEDAIAHNLIRTREKESEFSQLYASWGV